MQFLKISEKHLISFKFLLLSFFFILFVTNYSQGETFNDCFSQNFNFTCEDPFAFLQQQGIDINQNIIEYDDLRLKKKKFTGHSRGGIYKDSDKNVYYVKKCKIFNEIVGSRLMNLFVGTQASPVVKAVKNKKKMVAVQKLKAFRMKKKAKPYGKKILSQVKLSVAMDLIGSVDRHDRNMGFVKLKRKDLPESQLQKKYKKFYLAARVDYDACFDFKSTHGYTSKSDHRNLKHLRSTIKKYPADQVRTAIQEIVDVPDEKIVMAIVESWATLSRAGTKMPFEKCSELAYKLIERKKLFRDCLENPNSKLYSSLHKKEIHKEEIHEEEKRDQEIPKNQEDITLQDIFRRIY